MITKHCYRIVLITLCLFVGFGQIGSAQGPDDATNELKSVVVAPPDTLRMGSTLGGAYFVDKELYQRYEALKARLSQIREEIWRGDASSDVAMKSLTAIQRESKQLREELDRRKVLVSAFRVYSKTSEQIFPLADERLVIITGDDVIVRGWDGPGIKCVVEKIILAKEQQPDDSVFDSIQVKHEVKVAEEMVGLTRERRDQGEREFLASETGRKMTDEQRVGRKKLVDGIHHSYDDYLAFQGREANTIQLTGLSHQEGNRNLIMRINSPGGGAVSSSQWQRHAKMTVYIPACKYLAIRGCLAGLDIQSIDCDLLLTTHGSKNREYEGSFTVRGVNGNVTITQVPVRVLSEVTGDVLFTASNEFVNSGTHHGRAGRTMSSYETHKTRIDHIGGDLQATFLRTDLSLSAIKGTLDVTNHYGSTHLTVNAVDTDRAHRVVSESGRIRVDGPASILEKTPIYAYTQCGRLQTSLSRDILARASFSTGHPRIGWHGFVTPSKDRFDLRKIERPAAALENRERAAGLDLISHAGSVTIVTTETTE